jgi:protein SCO1
VGLFGLLVAAVVPAVVFPTLMCRQADPELADLGSVGAFALTDERSQPFTDAAMRGHVTVVSMLFTRCDNICPVTTMKMERLQDKTFDLGGQIQLASFSVDPNYDTSERLAEYAKRYHADPARWRFVTGDDAAVQKLLAGPFMSAIVAEGVSASGAPSIQHSGYFFLIDVDGHVRGTYDSNEIQRLDELVRDARYLARIGAARPG